MLVPRSLLRRASLAAGAAALAAPGGAAAASHHVARHVGLARPTAGAVVSGKVHYRARVVGRPARVTLRVDGRRVRTSAKGVLDTRRLRNGRHRLTVVATYVHPHARRARTVSVVVHNRRPKAHASALRGPTPVRWASSFERGAWWMDFNGANPVGRQPGQPEDPPIGPVNPASVGIPSDTGRHVMRFPMSAKDAAAGRIHSKLYKTWNVDGAGDGWPGLDGDVSGTYSADIFWPADRSLSCDANATTGLVGWKEIAHHRAIQDSTWWMTVAPACWAWNYPQAHWVGPKPTDPNAPVIYTRYWNYGKGSNDGARKGLYVMALPRGRWFRVRADLRDHVDITWHVDGKFMGRSLNGEYPVGPQYGRQADDQWTYEIGNYGNGRALGSTYFDRVTFTRL